MSKDKEQAGEEIVVPISSLHFGESPRLVPEDLDHARMLAEIEGGLLPPILVQAETMTVIAGRHLVLARGCVETARFELRCSMGTRTRLSSWRSGPTQLTASRSACPSASRPPVTSSSVGLAYLIARSPLSVACRPKQWPTGAGSHPLLFLVTPCGRLAARLDSVPKSLERRQPR